MKYCVHYTGCTKKTEFGGFFVYTADSKKGRPSKTLNDERARDADCLLFKAVKVDKSALISPVFFTGLVTSTLIVHGLRSLRTTFFESAVYIVWVLKM